jgi:hypothetical protein
MKRPFRAALTRRIRGYHIHQRTDRVGASARQSHDISTASSENLYLMSEVLTYKVLYRYFLTMVSYEDAA